MWGYNPCAMKIAAILLLALFALPTQEIPSTSQFHLVSASSTEVDQLGAKAEDHRVFLVNDVTGSVWEYSPSILLPPQTNGRAQFKNSGFYRVYIDGIDPASQRPKFVWSDTLSPSGRN